jgi:hypothetical protein
LYGYQIDFKFASRILLSKFKHFLNKSTSSGFKLGSAQQNIIKEQEHLIFPHSLKQMFCGHQELKEEEQLLPKEMTLKWCELLLLLWAGLQPQLAFSRQLIQHGGRLHHVAPGEGKRPPSWISLKYAWKAIFGSIFFRYTYLRIGSTKRNDGSRDYSMIKSSF